LAYTVKDNPKVACEVLIGHGECTIILETDVLFDEITIHSIVYRITEDSNINVHINLNKQDEALAHNQNKEIRCGDNGIFKGMPMTAEQMRLTAVAKLLYRDYPYDGKFLINNNKITICQSNVSTKDLKKRFRGAIVNPLGDWTGGLNVDSGATNRKLGSDMGDSITGGGLHGKDLSKADVTLNIYAFLKSQVDGDKVEYSCNIGDSKIDGKPYSEIVEIAQKYINEIGGFEKLAEWGLIR